jgi:Z1 domain
VTATPQAMFLQTPGHDFRPKFTVLSHPGADYVGGEDFFGESSTLVREFDLNDISVLAAGAQPSPGLQMPRSLLTALDTFMIGATFKRRKEADENCAFLCHVSTRTDDHKHIVDLLRHYKTELAGNLKSKNQSTIVRLKAAYEDLAATDTRLRETPFDDLVEAIAFYSPGINVKMVNGQTDEDVAVKSPYNLFVGGNKLGRGVTIKNLLVSYYGRNPKKPQADTVLQHARMYGYRRKDIGLLRLFLPRELRIVFKAINEMERGLRNLINRKPGEEFRGVYVESGVSATRGNVLAPGAIGVYSAGNIYNPAQILRDASSASATGKIDKKLEHIPDKQYREIPMAEIIDLVSTTMPDSKESERVWDSVAVAESIRHFADAQKLQTGYVFVDRDRGLEGNRGETKGILSGGEAGLVPSDKITLFILRIKAKGGRREAWWPQIRFPDGQYAFAFAI